MKYKYLLSVLLVLMTANICRAEGQSGVGVAFLLLILICSAAIALVVGFIVKGIISFTKYKPSDAWIFGITYFTVFISIVIWLISFLSD